MTPKREQNRSNRSPRRRKGVGGRISISRKLLAYLALFTLFILLVVWIMQIGLLNYFYRQSKYEELKVTDRLVTEVICNSPERLNQVVEECATDYLLCIRVFRVDGITARQLVSAEVSGDCLIHRISDHYLTYLYNQAVNGGGIYTKTVSPDALFVTNPEAMT